MSPLRRPTGLLGDARLGRVSAASRGGPYAGAAARVTTLQGPDARQARPNLGSTATGGRCGPHVRREHRPDGPARVYSTLAYVIAGLLAIALALLPKLGAVIAAIPVGAPGGAVTVVFGMIAVIGARDLESRRASTSATP